MVVDFGWNRCFYWVTQPPIKHPIIHPPVSNPPNLFVHQARLKKISPCSLPLTLYLEWLDMGSQCPKKTHTNKHSEWTTNAPDLNRRSVNIQADLKQPWIWTTEQRENIKNMKFIEVIGPGLQYFWNINNSDNLTKRPRLCHSLEILVRVMLFTLSLSARLDDTITMKWTIKF